MGIVETASNGRAPSGQFAAGNNAACGHRRRKKMAVLRSAFTDSISAEDVAEIVTTLVRMAKDGDANAAKLVLDRALGKTTALDSEDPPPDAPPTVAEQREALGPVTKENMEQHRAILLRELNSKSR